MKTVFSSYSQLCHKFNQQSQTEGRASNMFFEGDTIYSYGRHYILGQFLTPNLIVINNIGYSVSTTKHINTLRWETRDKAQIFSTRAHPQLVYNQVKNNFIKLANARKPDLYTSKIIYLYKGFVKSCNILGGVLHTNSCDGSYYVKPLKENILHTKQIEYINKIFKGLNTKEQAEQLALIKKHSKIERKEQAKLKQQRRKALRLSISGCGHYVETSQGFHIPINEAQRYYRLLKSGANMQGQKIAHYDTLNCKKFLKVGCQEIEHKEVNRIGELIINL